MRKVVSVVLLSLTLIVPQFGQQPPALGAIRRIQVGSMGQSDKAERSRLLLQEQLNKQGFEIAEKAEDADAVLACVFTVRVYADESVDAQQWY